MVESRVEDCLRRSLRIFSVDAFEVDGLGDLELTEEEVSKRGVFDD